MQLSNIVSKTLLLVEDEAIIAMTTARRLTTHGFQVLTALSGESAVQQARANAKIDLVLMDIDLGSGIDGTEAAQIILQERDIPVVFLSGHTSPEIVEKTEKITSYGYVVKGSSDAVLLASIKMAFKLHDANHRLEQSLGELRQVHTALQSSEHKYRRLVETLQEGIWSIDPDNRTTYVNPRMAAMLGYSVEEMQDRSLFDFMDEQGVERAKYLVERRRQGITENFEFEFLRKDGQRLYAQLETSALLDEQGKYMGATAAVQDVTDRRLARAALEQSERRFRALLENSRDAYILMQANGVILELSPSVSRISGYSNAEPLGEDVFNLIDPLDWPMARAIFENCLEHPGKVMAIEFRGRRKDDSVWWAEGSLVNLLFDPAVRAMVVNFRDVTEHRHMEMALLEREEKFAHAFQESPVMMAIIGIEESCFLDINRKMEELSGFQREELLRPNLSASGWLRAADWSRLVDHLRERGRIENLVVPFYPKGAGSPLHGLCSGTKIQIQGQEWLLLLAQDRIEHLQTQSATPTPLRRAEASEVTLWLMWSASPIAKELYDAEGRLVDVNPACLTLFGVSSLADVQGFRLFEDPNITVAIREKLRQGETVRYETDFDFETVRRLALYPTVRSGQIPISVLITPLFSDGSLSGFLVQVQDESRVKQTQRALEQALALQKKALLEKSVLLSDLQHRIKNSLMLISGLIELEEGSSTSPETREALTELRSRVNVLSGLYTILYGSDDANVVQLDAYLSKISRSVITSYHPTAEQFRLKITCQPVLADARQATSLGLILNELLTNAVKYGQGSNDEPGKIDVTLRIVDGPPDSARRLELAVTNDGYSLPAGFDLENAGGLGLQIVRMLASQLMGSVSCESGERTTFYLSVPMEQISPRD